MFHYKLYYQHSNLRKLKNSKILNTFGAHFALMTLEFVQKPLESRLSTTFTGKDKEKKILTFSYKALNTVTGTLCGLFFVFQ